ncbi:MAG: tail fiber domain-containing protein [Dyadobacter sp.]|uniref:tail fiber domain-containing protein n=1 Tax=Dyadobacter sp. TaxID=1914288 RepID=UPI0032632E64
MKKLLLVSFFLLSFLRLAAQAPQQFSFQGVARDAAGKVIANTNVSLRLTIHENLPLGPNLYQETHKPLTSNGGIFTVSVGAGNDKTGSMSDIKWSAGSFFLQVELDAAGSSNYIDLGATQLLSVPYALHAGQADKWKDGDPVVQRGKTGEGAILPSLPDGDLLLWYPRKAALRVGKNDSGFGAWDESNIGKYSVGFGNNPKASGQSSFSMGTTSVASGIASISVGYNNQATNNYTAAFGEETIASGFAAFAIGNSSVASGDLAFASGNFSESLGYYSFSAGTHSISKALSSATFGLFNNDDDSPSPFSPSLQDRIFQIGNGYHVSNRSNAFTILRNGNIGIGNNTLTPQFLLDIGGRVRIKYAQGKTAGIYFNDSQNNAEGFVGMKTDNEIGFYNANKWLFWMDNIGNSHIIGTNYNTSDLRLKRDFSSLSNSLTKLSNLNGYHYFWKDSTLDQTLQTGLLAQEVEAMFPELVKTDDKGFKSVNYTGLIPHLIEAVKELKASVDYLQTLNTAIKVQNEEFKARASDMDGFRKDLNDLKAAAQLISNSTVQPGQLNTTLSNSNHSEK